MPIPRFFVDLPLAAHSRIALPEAAAHHAVRVLRLRDGAPLCLFNGQGGEYAGVLHVDGRAAAVELGAFDPREAELGGAITLVQGLPSGDKMDWILEKAVELGVHTVVPIAARRSVLQLSGARQDKRLTHWRRIALSASEQCGRNRLLQVAEPVTLEQWLAAERSQAANAAINGATDAAGNVAVNGIPNAAMIGTAAAASLRVLCHPEGGQPYTQVLAQAQGAAAGLRELELLVGPEGGWDDTELAAARRAGAQAVTFGPRILRTETAGLALTAAAAAILGWV
ncbi:MULTISPECIES: 16S rRNA (uracil(1498)-N(3))-methyltransferase [unclassified Achromobacter]|uniref:16S rRNA (uracil(1498)-N(3))-methyltransferase n=1 Tax=unclassified Achromobacter TaxID=2626865 RepID=UPI000B5196E8|nr:MULTISPECIES: 16S rRNA (uracil(1498)-N(3))-methyltransferase [unclassified Achromobacter]OWT75334.1 16S rRNA (uracil(1498)-N(3))-methyltransferase [Achromobacter sp. HZ28]OWT75994.1 16S rRNA (uracil(1498)-N(3))-methyltransferase [Achromobacter sp. HZ34]